MRPTRWPNNPLTLHKIFPPAMGKNSMLWLVACGEVERPKPWNEEAAIRLIRLAGSVSLATMILGQGSQGG